MKIIFFIIIIFSKYSYAFNIVKSDDFENMTSLKEVKNFEEKAEKFEHKKNIEIKNYHKIDKKNQYSPIFGVDFQDLAQNNRNILRKRAIVEMGIKNSGNFEVSIKSNFADVSYNIADPNNRFGFELNKQIENFNFNLKYSF